MATAKKKVPAVHKGIIPPNTTTGKPGAVPTTAPMLKGGGKINKKK